MLDGSRIVSEQWDNKLMIFSYDESGAPIAIHYRLNGSAEDVFYTYYLEKNLQGDIIALYNSSGTKLVGYTYDAWGNCTTTYYNGGGSTGAQFNPFRYRGYYYDTGLELYYLNSRYYDSRTGRFINADGVLNGGVGLTSYNLFAYCSNNPIRFSDPSGNYAKDFKMTTLAPGTPTYTHGRPVYYEEKIPFLVHLKQIFDDCDNYNIWNKNPEAVFDSNYFSSYKGVLVIKSSFDASFSFGFIVLSHSQQNSNTLNHEYGHTVQLKNMGVCKYIVDVAIPSVTINLLSRADKLKYDYYGAPWEAQADLYGGVTRKTNNSPWPRNAYKSYADLLRMFFD